MGGAGFVGRSVSRSPVDPIVNGSRPISRDAVMGVIAYCSLLARGPILQKGPGTPIRIVEVEKPAQRVAAVARRTEIGRAKGAKHQSSGFLLARRKRFHELGVRLRHRSSVWKMARCTCDLPRTIFIAVFIKEREQWIGLGRRDDLHAHMRVRRDSRPLGRAAFAVAGGAIGVGRWSLGDRGSERARPQAMRIDGLRIAVDHVTGCAHRRVFEPRLGQTRGVVAR